MSKWIAMVVLTACGRFDFDPRDDAGDGPAVHRRLITVDNQATSTLAVGYSIRIENGGDLDPTALQSARVLESSAPLRALGLDRVIDDAPTAIWFALSAPIAPGTSQPYWLEYGDPSIVAPSDPNRVFPLTDEFSTLATSWQTLGSPVANGELVLAAGDNGVTTIPSTDRIEIASAIEARVAATAPAAAGTYYWVGYQHTGDFGTGAPFLNWVGEVDRIHPWVQSLVNLSCTDITPDTVFHRYRIERLPDSVRFYRDETMACEVTVTDDTDYSLQLRNQSTTNVLRIDWVRAMAFVSPPPAVTVGPEQ